MRKNAFGKTYKDYWRQQISFLFNGKRWLLHVLFWLMAIIYFYISLFVNKEVSIQINEHKTFETIQSLNGGKLIFFSWLIASILTYIYLIGLVPYIKYKFQRRYIWMSLFLIGILPCSIILFGVGFWAGYTKNFQALTEALIALLGIVSMQLVFIGLFYFIDLYDKQKTLIDYKEVFQKRLEAESKFLSSQVNPHFLFNTINNIYSLTIHNEKEAKVGVEMMEALISYIHHDSQSDWIDLESEIDFLKSYLNLELLRNKEQNVRLIFEVDGVLSNKKIAPLLIVNFIENAFKHGVKNNVGKSSVILRIDAYENNVVFVIRNKKHKQTDNELNQSVGGIGLKNVKRRLELIYQNNYELKIRDRKDYFEVKLTLGDIRW